MKKYVNVYEVTREFGGHEEGGWWYDNYSCIDTIKCKDKNEALDIQEKMIEKYSDNAYGDISSVHGGVDVRVYIDSEPKQYETTERPYYE